MVAALEDGWQMRGCLGDEWRWHVGPDKPWDAPGWLPARVPGSVLDDVARAGEVPDPYHGRNSLLAEWVPERAWVYRRRLDGGPEGVTLRFHGVDHTATVLVDGVERARHEGPYTTFRVDVEPGEHLLAVVVHPAPPSEPQVGVTSRVRVHRSRMGYGWDFCPRLVHQGIWRPVALDARPELVPSVRLEDGVGLVELHGEVVLRVESPELWWPNGMGEQRLYAVRADGYEFQVGFRTVEFDGLRFTVNGAAMPVRGWNWVPLDALYGVPRPGKLAHLLGLAARAHVNLLRVWGGGLVETPEFYEVCDSLGLLVWQEFSQSSSGIESVPSDDPRFIATLVEDARELVPRLRRHPSLAVWCGGNELARDGAPAGDEEPALEALRDVVRKLDPGRAWVATSPSGEGDLHGPWEHQGLAAHNRHYDAGTCVLHSEFGVEGMTNRRTLEALVAEDDRWPADRSNPVYAHLGAWWNNAPLVQEAFGRRIDDLETLRRASQWLQYEGLRYAVEAALRRGAGTIPWQLNESYPNAWCTSAVDHRGDPKPAYWGVARAYRPDHRSASFATSAWGAHPEARARVTGPARFVDLDGTVVAVSNDGELAARLDAFSADVFVLDLGANRYVMTRAETLAPLLELPAATVAVERNGGRLLLRHLAGPAALGLVIEDVRPHDAPGWLELEDNVIDLLPGESREIRCEGGGEVLVNGWNVAAMRV